MSDFYQIIIGPSSKVGKISSNVKLNFLVNLCFYLIVVNSQLEKNMRTCCSTLLSEETINILSVEEELSTSKLLSCVTHCFSLQEESIVVISDENLVHLNFAQIAVAFVTTKEFLNSGHGFFLRLNMIQTSNSSPETKRTNFIFIHNLESQAQNLIFKVDEELRILQSNSINKLIWQPFIIFLWMEIQPYFQTKNPNTHFIPGQNQMNSWVGKYKPEFSIDSGVFFVFIARPKEYNVRAQVGIHLVTWEVYNLKQNIIIETISLKPFLDLKYQPFELESGREKCMLYIFLERFRRRSNFRGVNVAAAVPEEALQGLSDWISAIRVENGNTSKIKLDHGFSVNIFHDLQLMMNFEEEVVLGTDKQSRASNETQTPLIPELNTDKADISLYQASMYKDRAEVCSFLQPTYSGIYLAFFQQPTASSIRNIVSAPFKPQLWLTLFAIWIILVGFIHCWASIAKGRHICSYYGDIRFVEEIGMWAIAASCQKSWYLFPRTSIFKIIFYIGTLMALVCNVAYNATIVSFLTVETLPVKTFTDLITNGYKFSVHEKSQGTILMLEAMIAEFNLLQNVITTDTQHEISHIINSKIAFLSYPDLFYQTARKQNFTENFVCSKIFKLAAQGAPFKSAVYVKKGSQFREIFAEKLIFIMERGLNYRYKKEYDTKRQVSCATERWYTQNEGLINVDPVWLSDVFTAFLVVFVGWALASWILLSERLYSREILF